MAKIGQGGKKSFLFREFSQNILFGTASDRYAGWIGQDSEKRIAHGAWDRGHRAKGIV
jgi:hypothetical protein